MRRLVALAAVLALALSLSVPAFAAESYVFEYWEPMFYSDFELIEDSAYFMLEEPLPSGHYHCTFVLPFVEFDFDVLDVRFVPGEFLDMHGMVWEQELSGTAPDGSYFNCRLALFVGDILGRSVTVLSVYELDEGYYLQAPEGSFVRFLPASNSGVALSALSGLSVVLGVVLDVILGNWFLSLLLCLSLVGLGVVAFRKLRRSR